MSFQKFARIIWNLLIRVNSVFYKYLIDLIDSESSSEGQQFGFYRPAYRQAGSELLKCILLGTSSEGQYRKVRKDKSYNLKMTVKIIP